MNSANLNTVCSLCRREMPQGAGVNTSRLCDDCRSIIETIRPRTPKTSPLGGSQQLKEDLPVQLPVEREAPALTIQPAPAHAEPQPAAQSQPLREYDTPAVSSQYRHNGIEDDTLGEWPFVVQQDSAKGRSKVSIGIIAVALLLVAGAALFLAYRYFGGRNAAVGAAENHQVDPPALPARTGMEKPAQTASPPSGGQSVAVTPTPGTAPNPNQAPTPAAQPPAEQAAHGTAPPTSAAAGGKFTAFQIASFPNEAAAKEFCDRLIRAGVPAYTVRADIPGRGKWFRVRAGRFGNPQESQQSGNAWRRLAGAAGINLQLVQCDYEQ